MVRFAPATTATTPHPLAPETQRFYVAVARSKQSQGCAHCPPARPFWGDGRRHGPLPRLWAVPGPHLACQAATPSCTGKGQASRGAFPHTMAFTSHPLPTHPQPHNGPSEPAIGQDREHTGPLFPQHCSAPLGISRSPGLCLLPPRPPSASKEGRLPCLSLARVPINLTLTHGRHFRAGDQGSERDK